MKKKIDEVTKEKGMLKICEFCNWDVADIGLFYERESSYKNKNQISRLKSEYKQFIKDFNKVIKDSPRMLEIQAKLRGNYDN